MGMNIFLQGSYKSCSFSYLFAARAPRRQDFSPRFISRQKVSVPKELIFVKIINVDDTINHHSRSRLAINSLFCRKFKAFSMLPEIKLAFYRKEDWEKFLESVDDKDSMHDTWEEWYKDFNKAKNRFKREGFKVHEVTIDIDALNRHCRERNLKNNGKTRSEYVTQLPLAGNKKK
jgi:hypothetical protein